MFCTSCGAKIPDGSKFCPACGAAQRPVGQPMGASQQNAGAVSSAGTSAQASDASQPTAVADGQRAASAAGQPGAAGKSGADAVGWPGTGATSQPTATPQAGAMPQQTAPQPRRSRRTPIIAAVTVVLVAAAGVLAWLLLFAPFSIDEKSFPDAAVRNVVLTQLDQDGDGKLSRDEASAVTALTASDASTVSGLGHYFKNLDTLQVSGQSATEVATDDLPNLKSLDVSGTSVQQVDVSKNPKLESVNVSNTPVSSLDTSNNGELRDIKVAGSKVSSLDVSKNPKLEKVDADTTTQVGGLDQTNLREVDLLTEIHETGTSSQGTSDRYAWKATYNPDGTIASQSGGFLGSGITGEKTTTYTYDDQGRITGASKQALVGSYGDGDYTYEYDDQGRVTKASSEKLTYSYAYDDQGRLASKTTAQSGGSFTDAYEYDDQGRLVKTTTTGASSSYPGGSQLTYYKYDESGNLTEIQFDGGYADSRYKYDFTYDDKGHVTKSAYSSPSSADPANGYALTFAYDDQGRIAKVQPGSGGEPYEFSYDDAGRLSQVTYKYGEYSSTWKLTYGAKTYVKKDAKEPEQAFTMGPVYVPDPYAPNPGVFQATPDLPASPEPLDAGNLVMHQ